MVILRNILLPLRRLIQKYFFISPVPPLSASVFHIIYQRLIVYLGANIEVASLIFAALYPTGWAWFYRPIGLRCNQGNVHLPRRHCEMQRHEQARRFRHEHRTTGCSERTGQRVSSITTSTSSIFSGSLTT